MDTNLAILPFKELSSDESVSLLMQGFTEDLIINLSRFTGLSLIALESTAEVRGIEELDAIARLGADYTLGGSYRNFRERLRIAIQLVRVRDGKIVFASDYVESVEAIFNMQDEALKQIVNAIQQNIDYDLLSHSYTKPRAQLAAYENYLQGMAILSRGGVENDVEARTYFETALSIDPTYARAYTGLSQSYFNFLSCQLWDRWDISQRGALKYALQALELDGNDYIALAVAGRVLLFSGAYDRAEHYLRKSISINPNDADNLVQVAFSMIFLGYAAESEQLYHKACKLNPLHSDAYYSCGATIYFELGEYQKMIELGNRLGVESSYVDFPAYVAASHYYLSEFDKMEENWQLYLKMYGKHITPEKDFTEEEAIAWQIRINPYKCPTRLQGFWDFLRGDRELPVAEQKMKVPPVQNRFIHQGEFWELGFKGENMMLPDAKGLHDLRKLLQHPEREFHCTDLMAAGLEGEDRVEVFDQQAKASYRKRVVHLQAEMEDAREFGDTTRLGELEQEYDTLLEHLSSSIGLGGKTRTAATSVEKARSAVTWRIRSSIKKIEKNLPQLAKHLNSSIKTGTFCSYRPEVPLEWQC